MLSRVFERNKKKIGRSYRVDTRLEFNSIIFSRESERDGEGGYRVQNSPNARVLRFVLIIVRMEAASM